MIDAIIADRQELFRAGLVEVLSVVEDVRIVGQAQSPEHLLSTLKKVNPHVLVLSTNSLPVFRKIERMLKRRKTALQLLAEENDQVDYMKWLRPRHRLSFGGCTRPPGRDAPSVGELFLQDPSS